MDNDTAIVFTVSLLAVPFILALSSKLDDYLEDRWIRAEERKNQPQFPTAIARYRKP